MPYVMGPILIANQAFVDGSASTKGKTLLRNSSTFVSKPGLASSRTYSAFSTMIVAFLDVKFVHANQ